MDNTIIAILVGVVSLVTSTVVFPFALKIAKMYKIVDNPNARKLQRVPVPVFGGVVVYSGILMGGLLLQALIPSTTLAWGLVAATVMMVIGTWDDVKDLPASFRFLIEILLLTGFILITGTYIDDLHGMWGIHELDPMVGIPLSVFMGLTLINAVNMIDGVDGYSSGYGMIACMCVAIAFWSVWSPLMVCIAIMVFAALFPFFLHNVFGKKSRMFIGDGGTLMLGMIIVEMGFSSMSSSSKMDSLAQNGMSIMAFLTAVALIPLFDTFRVFLMRLLRGRSPFKPDKTHLHHLFIDMGFSHLGAALFILSINMMVVLIWLLTWKLGASMEVQFYIVFVLGFLVTMGFYKFMKIQQNGGPMDEGYPQGTKLWHVMCRLGAWTHRENKPFWRFMQYLMDGPLFRGKFTSRP